MSGVSGVEQKILLVLYAQCESHIIPHPFSTLEIWYFNAPMDYSLHVCNNSSSFSAILNQTAILLTLGIYDQGRNYNVNWRGEGYKSNSN